MRLAIFLILLTLPALAAEKPSKPAKIIKVKLPKYDPSEWVIPKVERKWNLPYPIPKLMPVKKPPICGFPKAEKPSMPIKGPPT